MRPASLRGIAASADGRMLTLTGMYAFFLQQLDAIDGNNWSSKLIRQDRWSTAVCADPSSRSNGFFVAGMQALMYVDGGIVSAVMQYDLHPYDNEIRWISGVVCTLDGSTLYLTDADQSLVCQVDAKSGKIIRRKTGTGTDGFSYPRKLAFYRSTDIKPESILYFTTANGIFRLAVDSFAVSKLVMPTKIWPRAIGCTAAGVLVFSCDRSFCLYAVHPSFGVLERLAGRVGCVGVSDGDSLGTASFETINDLCLSDNRVWIVENKRLRTVDLPPHLFSS